MADRQNHNLFPVVVIQGDVGPLPEFNHPLAELWWQLFDRPANLRMLAERFHTLPDGIDGALCSIPALGSQKLMETGHIQQGWLGPPYTWHLGITARLPASSLASQASASPAVMCRPVA
jgi:hypothetical protein